MSISKRIVGFLLALVVFSSCIQPVDIDPVAFESVLVVEGNITTERTTHVIRLTESAKYGGVLSGTNEPIINALVYIKDSEGFTTLLDHDDFGLYETPDDFMGVIGRTYALIIEWDGKVYNSRQELLEKINEIDNIYSLYNSYPKLNEAGNLAYSTGTDIYVEYEKQEGTADYLLWDYESNFQIRTFPELFQVATRTGLVPAPKDCCSDCFEVEESGNIVISTFPLGNDKVSSRLFFIEDDGYRFTGEYVTAITRYTLSRDAYLFFDLVNGQLEIDGEIFDPPPSTLRGNIVNIEDPDEIVVGYFHASDIARDTLVLDDSDFEAIVPLPVFENDCLLFSNTTTTSAPDLWLNAPR